MMKNKKFTYFVLLPAVLIVWGLITYRILDRNNEDYSSFDLVNNKREIQTVPENREYHLLYNYRDPFSGHQPFQEKMDGSDNVEIQQRKDQIKWPAIRFNGYILNGNKIKCHLTIEGVDKIFQEHEKISENHVILKITPDSVKVGCNNDFRWYKNGQ